MKKNFLKVLLFVLFTWPLLSAAEDLQYFLNLDRFDYYKSQLAITVQKRGRADVADALRAMTPEAILDAKITSEQMSDAGKYDELIIQLLHQKAPKLQFQESEVRWEYNFFKNKLNEAYRVRNGAIPEKISVPGHEIAEGIFDHPDIAAPTLDADAYISNRTTRAVFWDATHEHRTLEFHMGTERDFLENMKKRNAKVLGEVAPSARNYNKIYLIQLPDETRYRYAFSAIGGRDRLDHLTRQIDLASWHRSPTEHPPVEIHGTAEEFLGRTEAILTKQFQALPRADKTIIGQAGAIQSMFVTASKRDAVLRAYQKNPTQVRAALNAQQMKAVEKLAASQKVFAPGESGSLWDGIKDALEPVFKTTGIQVEDRFKTFTIDNETHKITDYVLETQGGQKRRWRVISNMWGDEIVPVANALKKTGYRDVSYIGTAGAFPGSGLKVGDLYVPDQFADPSGKIWTVKPGNPVPEGAKKGGTVAHVGSPFQETHPWLAKQTGKAQAVELETGYLAKVFNGKEDKLTTYLLISDVISSETENLSQAASSSRRGSLDSVLNQLLSDDSAIKPTSTLPAATEAATAGAASRDPVSRYQVTQVAKKMGYSKPEEIQKLLASEKSFTASFLQKNLEKADAPLTSLLHQLANEGITPRVSFGTSFLDGTWNPKSEPIELTLHVDSQNNVSKLEQIVQEFREHNKTLKNLLTVRTAQGPPPAGTELLALHKSGAADGKLLFEAYHEAALFNGGLVVQYTPSGTLKHVEIPLANPAGFCAKPTPNCEIAFFTPDKATQEAIQKLVRSDASGESVLSSVIEKINASRGSKETAYLYQYSKVPSLPDGSLARIMPEISKDKGLIIHVKITEQGLKTPPVVLEELVHLAEISGQPYIAGLSSTANEKYRRFYSPMEWAETTWNSEAGSKVAQLKLARFELDAAREASDLAAKANILSPLYGQSALPSAAEQAAFFEKRTAHAEELATLALKEAKIDLKQRNAEWEKVKPLFDKLEAEPLKLNDLVLKNDRKGVRKLLQSYLPWSLMEPSEKSAWTQWLDAIEKPDPKRLRLEFRGLQDDLLLKNAKGEIANLSTVLTKNQGSYTRRLRSLATLREKIGTQVFRGEGSIFDIKQDELGSLSRILKNHATEAKGSPFLSLATHDVAMRFGMSGDSMRMAAYLIDERRLLPNFASYVSEVEVLTPLIVFPDEVAAFLDIPKGTTPETAESMKQAFLEKIKNRMGGSIEEGAMKYTLLDEDKFRMQGVTRFAELTRSPPPAPGKTGSKQNCLTPLITILKEAPASP